MTIRGIPLGTLLIGVIAAVAAIIIAWFNLELAVAVFCIGVGVTFMIAHKAKKG